MPHFYFDLVIGEEFKDQGGMILEDTQIAFDKPIAWQPSFRPCVQSYVREVAPFESPTAKTRNSIGRRSILFPCGSEQAVTRDGIFRRSDRSASLLSQPR